MISIRYSICVDLTHNVNVKQYHYFSKYYFVKYQAAVVTIRNIKNKIILIKQQFKNRKRKNEKNEKYAKAKEKMIMF